MISLLGFGNLTSNVQFAQFSSNKLIDIKELFALEIESQKFILISQVKQNFESD